MANVICNIAKGKWGQWVDNVENNSPANAVIRIFAIAAGAATDDNLRDADTMTALFATAAAEVTNTNYANIALDETDITITVDDTGNTLDVTFADQTWSSINAGDDWTDIVIAYDADGSDTDSTTIPISVHDFSVSPNGGDITADFPALTLEAS